MFVFTVLLSLPFFFLGIDQLKDNEKPIRVSRHHRQNKLNIDFWVLPEEKQNLEIERTGTSLDFFELRVLLSFEPGSKI